MIETLLLESLTEFVRFLPILIGALLLSQVVRMFLDEEYLRGIRSGGSGLAGATAVGIAMPGPIMGYLPVLKQLKEKGLKNPLAVSFLTAQALMGPFRVVLELSFFGWVFFLVHIVVIAVVSLLGGVLMRVIQPK